MRRLHLLDGAPVALVVPAAGSSTAVVAGGLQASGWAVVIADALAEPRSFDLVVVPVGPDGPPVGHQPAAVAAIRAGVPLVAYGPGAPGEVAAAIAGGAEDHVRVEDGEAGVAARMGAVRRRREDRRRLERQLAQAVHQGRTDELTGLLNRRGVVEALEHHHALAQRRGTDLAIAMFDVDHFKRINDRFGHPAGDDVLAVVAAIIQHAVRDADVVGRWGGEEFLAILPGTDLGGATTAADHVRSRVASLPRHEELAVTVSAGCAAAPGSVQQLLDRADLSLYEAKAAGRNRVSAAG